MAYRHVPIYVWDIKTRIYPNIPFVLCRWKFLGFCHSLLLVTLLNHGEWLWSSGRILRSRAKDMRFMCNARKGAWRWRVPSLLCTVILYRSVTELMWNAVHKENVYLFIRFSKSVIPPLHPPRTALSPYKYSTWTWASSTYYASTRL